MKKDVDEHTLWVCPILQIPNERLGNEEIFRKFVTSHFILLFDFILVREIDMIPNFQECLPS